VPASRLSWLRPEILPAQACGQGEKAQGFLIDQGIGQITEVSHQRAGVDLGACHPSGANCWPPTFDRQNRTVRHRTFKMRLSSSQGLSAPLHGQTDSRDIRALQHVKEPSSVVKVLQYPLSSTAMWVPLPFWRFPSPPGTQQSHASLMDPLLRTEIAAISTIHQRLFSPPLH